MERNVRVDQRKIHRAEASSKEYISCRDHLISFSNSRLCRANSLLLDEHAAQDLAGGRLGDRVDELERRTFLCGATRSATNAISSSARRRRLQHDERLRDFAGFLVRTGDDGRVGDAGWRSSIASSSAGATW